MNKIKLPYSGLEATQDDNPDAFPTLEITENGKYNVRGYQYANVNVEGGGGLFKAVNLYFNNSVDSPCNALGPFHSSEPDTIWDTYSWIAHATGTFEVVIPNNGGAIIKFLDGTGNVISSDNFEIEGSVDLSEDDNDSFYVFGNCSITRHEGIS